jgi:hypothetical protein
MARLLISAVVVVTVAAACGEPSAQFQRGDSDEGIAMEVSPVIARAGDEIEIRISSPDGVTNGLETFLEREDPDGWTPISWLFARPDGGTGEFVASKRGRVPQIGFEGRGLVRAIVPEIAPGDYRLSKEFFRGGGPTSVAHARFEITE